MQLRPPCLAKRWTLFVAEATSVLLMLALSVCAGTQASGEEAQVVEIPDALRDQCEQVLRRGLQSEEFWPSMHAAEALTFAGHRAEVRDALASRIAQQPDPQKRCGLARETIRAGDRRHLTVLFEILADPHSNGRIHAAESLYKIAEVGEGDALRAALEERQNPKLRLMAAAALARCGHPGALEIVRRQLESDERDARNIAAWILGVLGEAADIPALTATLNREQEPVARAYLIHALANRGDAEGRRLLGETLRSTDPVIRAYAAECAGISRATEYHEQLVQLLGDGTLDVRVRAAQSLLIWASPPVDRKEVIRRDVYAASAANPRYSEGSVITLQDGSLVYATTEFLGGGADHATAHIVARRSTDDGRTWDAPQVLQENVGQQNVMSVTLRRLMPGQAHGPIGMFYLVKNGPQDLHVYLKVSHDELSSFEKEIRVSSRPGYHVMNNDRVSVLSSGRLICPVSWTPDLARDHFVAFCYVSDDRGQSWRATDGQVELSRRGAMEPEVLELASGELLMIIRTQLGYIATSRSSDGGEHWSEPGRLSVPSPESPATIRRIPATGDLLLVWNNSYDPSSSHGGRRWPLTAAISRDNGTTWAHLRNLDAQSGEAYAYTSVVFVRDRVVLSYYVQAEATGRISSRLQSLPVAWLYEAGEAE